MSQRSLDVHRMTVRNVIHETADAVSIVFDARLPYSPGQFLTLRVPGDSGPVARCYSLSSAPGVDPHLQVTVKRTAGGYASNWLCDNVVAGVEIEALPPAGVFVPKRWNDDLLLFAGGSGITPMLSIVKTAMHEHRNRITLVYANRNAESVIFADQLATLERQFPKRFRMIHWLESDSGLPTAPALRARMKNPSGDVFVCGPVPFMAVVDDYLRAESVARDRIRKEVFVSLASDAFELAEPEDVDASGGATVLAELDGAEHRLRWPRQRPLLDVLLAAGLEPEYSCREGSCGACAYMLRSGEVKMLANDTLDSYELDRGVRLACQSVPITDDVHVAFDQ